jgi:hypothetical protein
MSVVARLPVLVLMMLAGVAVMAWGAAQVWPGLASVTAGASALVLIVVAYLSNRSLWRLPADRITAVAAPVAGVRNASLIALAYGWGAASLTAIYVLSGLRWQHGLQYAAGMALIGVLIAVYARNLAKPDSPLRAPRAQLAMLRITVLHAMAAAGGLGFLFLSGKLKSGKGDWPANIVFLMGGLAVLSLSAIAAITQWRLSRRN